MLRVLPALVQPGHASVHVHLAYHGFASANGQVSCMFGNVAGIGHGQA